MVGGRRFRRLNRRGLQNFVLNLNEKKFYDEFVTVTDANKDGAMFCLTDIPQGSSVITRVGDKVVMRNLIVRGRIFYDWTDTTHRTSYGPEVRVRILIFIWKDDTDPDVGDLVDSPVSFFTIDACSFILNNISIAIFSTKVSAIKSGNSFDSPSLSSNSLPPQLPIQSLLS